MMSNSPRITWFLAALFIAATSVTAASDTGKPSQLTDGDVPPLFPVPPPHIFSHLGDADFGWYDVTK